MLPERALLAVLEGTRDRLGVLALCPALLASVIEMQTLGRVTTRPVPARRPTRTDATISADLVNAFLAELGHELAGLEAMPMLAEWRYATYLDDPRALCLMLEDVAMLRLAISFRMGAGGQRDGSILLALPVSARASRPAAVARLAGAGDATAGPGAGPENALSALAGLVPAAAATLSAPGAAPAPPADLAAEVREAPVTLVGVLCRRRLSLGSLRAMGPGSLIALPPNALDEARVETVHGQLLAQGRLGEAEGFHAIRLRPAAPARSATPEGPGACGPGTDGLAPPLARHTAVPPPVGGPVEPPAADLDQPDPFRMTGADAPELPDQRAR